MPGRPQEDKKIKDLEDICALLLYSGGPPADLSKTDMDREIRKSYLNALDSISDENWKDIASSLDLTIALAKRVARQL